MGLPLLSLPDSGLYLEDAPDFDGVATPEDARELGREFRWDTGLDVGLDVGREDARETVLEGALDGTLEFCLEVLGVDNPDRFRLASSLALCSSTYAVAGVCSVARASGSPSPHRRSYCRSVRPLRSSSAAV